MSNPVLNQNNRPGAFPVIGCSIASGLLLALFNTFGYSISAQPLTTSLVSQARPAANPNTVNQRLMGQWQAKVSASGQTLTFVFGPNGKLSIVLPSSSNPAPAMELRYRVASTSTSPMQIDMIAKDNKIAPTIFEFTPDGKLRIQLEGTNPGVSRPATFATNATVFDKISNATTLPPNARITQTQTPRR
ncbi:hypothetical protein [Argonema antarcticum]|uniref:hypothetical protein n=1 Tax=Argonema antarcticum TaxID=2942763 RepID=UPI002013AD3C|nr:hypothetical protein [Argonema antarcticum]MCL1472326.1 hypothetical protein [Argonema antarcticum A004/B2]